MSDQGYPRYEAALEAAKRKGCIIVAPTARELFVDIDDLHHLGLFHANIERLRAIEPCTFKIMNSQSRKEGRYHATVTLDRDVKSEEERILLQALLGSDITREMVGLQRARRGEPVPTLFFERAK